MVKRLLILLAFMTTILFLPSVYLINESSAQKRTPLEKNQLITITSLPDKALEGAEINVVDVAANKEAIVSGNIVLIIKDGDLKPCLWCAQLINIKPNLTVRIDKKTSINSGFNGAKLKRTVTGKQIMLIDGEAYIIKK